MEVDGFKKYILKTQQERLFPNLVNGVIVVEYGHAEYGINKGFIKNANMQLICILIGN